MGWAIVALFAIASFAALWRFGKMPRLARELAGAALLIGFAGYAWQGSPGQPGSPTTPKADAMQPDSSFAEQRERFMGRFGSAAEWLNFADALHRMGNDRSAVTAIKSGLAQRPNDPDLWVGLGNALVIHGDGLVSPAARLAFDRAAKLSPEHPAPPFFLGLAYAQGGQTEKAAGTWRALLARSPADAPWRGEVEARLAELEGQGAATP